MTIPIRLLRTSDTPGPADFLRGDATWEPAVINGNAFRPRQIGGYYAGEFGGTHGYQTVAIDNINAVPFLVPVSTVFDRIAFAKGNNGTAGSVGWAAVYGNKSTSEFYPDALLVQGAVHALDGTEVSGAAFFADTISLSLSSGIYWLAFLNGVAASSTIWGPPSLGAADSGFKSIMPFVSGTSAAAIAPGERYRGAFAYQASAPNPFPAAIARTTGAAACPLLRVGSFP